MMDAVVYLVGVGIILWVGWTNRPWPSAIACFLSILCAVWGSVAESGAYVAWYLLIAILYFVCFIYKAWVQLPRVPHEPSAKERLGQRDG